MKKYNKILKITSLLVVTSILVLCFAGCKGGENKAGGGNITKLSFKEASGYDYLKTLDGEQVTISGYMATNSPVDGSFMFLMNLPYQSCPFCVPNTSELSNTMEVYPKANETFSYTSQAIKVVGTLQVAENEDEPFTDEYGYEFNYKIVDATYTIIKAEDLSDDMALWQKIAESDVINDIYAMYDYVNFLCYWNTYFVETHTTEDGQQVSGYYLYPADAENFIYKDGAQYYYGYKEGYFDGIVGKIEAVDKEAFSDLVENVRKAEKLANKALKELEDKNYTSEYKYIEKFETEDYVYTLNNEAELTKEMETLYTEFANWLGSWEM